MKQRVLVALVAGVGLTFAFDPVGIGWFAPFGVAGYIWACHGPRPWLPGLVFGIAFCFLHISWMWSSVGLAAWLALAGGLAIFHAVFAIGMRLVLDLPGWPVWAAAVWTALELSRGSWPFSGMPWGRLAFATADLPIAPALAYVGVTGMGFGIALCGALLLCLRTTPAKWGLASVIGLFTLSALFPFSAPATGTAQVAVVQGNVPGDGTNLGRYPVEVTQNHARATVELAERVEAGQEPQPDFVIWPENSTVADPLIDAETTAAIAQASTAIDVPILIGGMIKSGENEILNQGIVWDPVTGAGDRYTKRHPVPFGEYIPLLEPIHRWFSGANFGGLNQIGRDMASGSRTEPLVIAGTPLADAICFDVAYDDVLVPQVANGARLATVQTSNAMFIKTIQVEQQFQITRVRAIELGRTVLVAATNGVTGVIGADGRVVDRVPIRTTAVINTSAPLYDALTPAVRLGRWPGVGLFGLALTTMAVSLVLRFKRRPGSTRTAAMDPPDSTAGREEVLDERLA